MNTRNQLPLVFPVILALLLLPVLFELKKQQDSRSVLKRLVQASNMQGWIILQDLAKTDKGKNLLVAPAATADSGLALLLGLKGECRDRYARRFRLGERELAELSLYARDFLKTQESKSPVARVALAVYASDQVILNPRYQSLLSNGLAAESGEAARSDWPRIKAYIEGVSNSGRPLSIDEPQAKSISFISSAYFKGSWLEEFDIQETKDRPFQLLDGSRKTLPSMSRIFEETHKHLKTDSFEGIRLPYASASENENRDANFSMYLLLPARNMDFYVFLKNAAFLSLDSRDWKEESGSLTVPRFRIQAKQELPFETKDIESSADLSGMINNAAGNVNWSARQELQLEFNEKGTEAEVINEINGSLGTVDSPFHMVIDRPFVFVLRNDLTKTILFLGAVVDPQDSKLSFAESEKRWLELLSSERKKYAQNPEQAMLQSRLCDIAGFYLREKYLEKALQSLEEARTLSKDPDERINCMELLATVYAESPQTYQQAVKLYQEILAYEKANKRQPYSYGSSLSQYEKLLRKMHLNLADVKKEEERILKKDLEFWLKCQEEEKAGPDQEEDMLSEHNVAISELNLADFYKRFGDDMDAERYYKDALRRLKSRKASEPILSYEIAAKYRDLIVSRASKEELAGLDREMASWEKEGKFDPQNLDFYTSE